MPARLLFLSHSHSRNGDEQISKTKAIHQRIPDLLSLIDDTEKDVNIVSSRLLTME